jgi:transposase
MRPYGTAQNLQKRRSKAIDLLQSGESFRAVAKKLGASLSSVVRWHQAFEQKGKIGLQPKPAPGRPSWLTDSQKRRLQKLLVKGPLEAGYPTDLWTLKRIGEMIEKEFGICYCISNLWKLMIALEWSCQKPEKRARERNEKAIQHWVHYQWPRIKKNR